MSGGQRQRVALTRAIVKRPKVFLMDEPLSNLDAKLRTEMRMELMELYAKLRTTFLYVTHDQVEAMSMGTNIVILNNGEVQQQGAPREIYENPANVFVAGFTGSPPANLIRCGEFTLAVRPESVGQRPRMRGA
jgi:sn-glycerol 3-phosphate transport system ATP-binding protein